MYKIVLLLCWVLVACEPRGIESISVGIVWKAKTVKENGKIVYEASNLNNRKPDYEKFRLDLLSKDKVIYTDSASRKLYGTWQLSDAKDRLILTDLFPESSEASCRIEFSVLDIITKRKLVLKRTSESVKTGKTSIEYQLMPE